MSKLIDSLKQAQATMAKNPAQTQEVSPSETPQQPKAVVAEEKLSHVQFSPKAFYPAFIVVAVIVMFALISSYKAISLIHGKNVEVGELASLITKQNDKIKSLEDSILQVNSQQSEQLTDLKKSFSVVEQVIDMNNKQLVEINAKYDTLSVAVNTLKNDIREFRNNDNYLTTEINRLKQIVAKMTENPIPPSQ